MALALSRPFPRLPETALARSEPLTAHGLLLLEISYMKLLALFGRVRILDGVSGAQTPGPEHSVGVLLMLSAT